MDETFCQGKKESNCQIPTYGALPSTGVFWNDDLRRKEREVVIKIQKTHIGPPLANPNGYFSLQLPPLHLGIWGMTTTLIVIGTKWIIVSLQNLNL